MHQANIIRATACLLGVVSLSPASLSRVMAQANPTYALFNNSVDLYLQQTCTDTPNGATFTGTIGASSRAGGTGQPSLYYAFDGSGKKTGYESASAVNSLNIASAGSASTSSGVPGGAVRFRFVAVSADCSGESLYVWPGSAQSVQDPDSGLYAYSFSEAVEEPLH